MSCVCGGACIAGPGCSGGPSCGGDLTPVPNVQGYLVAISGVGAPGPKGDPGERGETGPAGKDSTVPGPVGPAGPAGAPSTVPGPAGPVGATGPAGAAGSPGSKGDKGDVGATGPAGAPGTPGNVGATGAAGPVGPIGPAGPAGGTGPQGEIGKTGPAGPAGAASTVPGPAGPAGPAGPTGPASTVPGPAGPTGPTGPAGPASTVPGPAGATGPAGPAGADSTVPGPVGPQGPAGPTGPAGADSTVPGPAGPAGAAATIAVGTTTTGAAGSAATVINTGTTSAAVFAFTVPAGVAGAQGVPGVQGPAGLGIQFKGEVPTFADLPSTGQVQGDLWTVASPLPAHGWAWDAATSSWVDAGQIQGPQGIPGPVSTVPGPQGPAGPSAVSKDVGNTSVLGTDGLIFTPAGSGPAYTLPVATSSVLGGVKVGSGLSVDGTGVLSATVASGFLPLSGGTMTGTIVAPTNVNAISFGTTGYGVLGGTGGVAMRSGNTNLTTFTGTNVTYGVQLITANTATAVKFGSSGPTLGVAAGVIQASSVIDAAAAPTAPSHLANKAYVDSVAGGSSVSNPVAGSTAGLVLWTGSQSAYDAIATKDPKTVYMVV